jgi:hypothetical protein
MIEYKYYSIPELSQFGICSKILRDWHKQGILKQSTFINQIPKFRYKDLEEACNKMNNSKKLENEKFEQALIYKLKK